MSTRRQTQRAATVRDIKEAALARIAADGAPRLSLRAVARDIGMSPAGLYRYYDGRDALLTELLTDAYENLAETMESATAGPGDPIDRFSDAVHAYRRWAIEDRNRFLLVFGTPIPGYAAPEDGPTVAANRRMGEALFAVAAEAWMAGRLVAPEPTRPLEAGERELAASIAESAPGFPAALVPVLLGAWAHWHGLVVLEVTDQLHWLYPDPAVFFDGEVDRIVAGLAG